jgi:hypothetical protein
MSSETANNVLTITHFPKPKAVLLALLMPENLENLENLANRHASPNKQTNKQTIAQKDKFQ